MFSSRAVHVKPDEGFEQVRSVVADVVDDWDAALRGARAVRDCAKSDAASRSSCRSGRASRRCPACRARKRVLLARGADHVLRGVDQRSLLWHDGVLDLRLPVRTADTPVTDAD